MRYGITYTPVAGPAGPGEPVDLYEAKRQCRVDSGFEADDGLFADLLAAARDLAERHSGRLLAPRAATVTLPGFPPGAVRLPVEPVRAVTAVRYRAADGTQAVLDPSAYRAALAYSPPTVAPAPGAGWPNTEAGNGAAVEIDLACGPLAADLPPRARRAILLAVDYWYAHRGDGGDPEKGGLPPAAVRLLNLLDTGGYS